MVCGSESLSDEGIEKSLSSKKFDDKIPGYGSLSFSEDGRFSMRELLVSQAIYVNLIDKVKCTHQNISCFYPSLESDLQIKLFEYMNCDFFQVFRDENRSTMQIANGELNGFSATFISLFRANESLIREYEKLYGPLE